MRPTAFDVYPGRIPDWFLGIVEKYVAKTEQAQAVVAYVEANRRLPLTVRQHEIYTFIAGHIDAEGYAPSMEEIASLFGFSSLATVHEHLTNLERKGWIEREFNLARSIRLVAA